MLNSSYGAGQTCFKMFAEYKHNQNAFTQGLEYYGNKLYESTGLYGQSSVRVSHLPNVDQLEKRVSNNSEEFGEGLTIHNGLVYQLTWKSGKLNRYSLKDLSQRGSLTYDGQGWGLTHNDRYFIMSDGTKQLHFHEFETFKRKKSLTIYLEKKSDNLQIQGLNELEYVHGKIYANVWFQSYVLIIEESTGRVIGKVDLTPLVSDHDKKFNNVLNGIAYLPEKKRFLVTGKRWRKIYEISIDESCAAL